MWNYLSIRFRDWIIGPRRYHLRISIRDSLRETCFRDLRGSKAKDFLGYHRRLGLSKLRGVLEYFCVWIVIRWLPVRFESENSTVSTISKTPGHSKDTSVLVDIRNTFEIPSVFEYLNAISTYEGTLMDEHRVGEYHIAIHRSRSLTIYLSIYVSIHPCIYIYGMLYQYGTALVFAAVWNRSDWILVPVGGRFRNLRWKEGIRVKFGFRINPLAMLSQNRWFLGVIEIVSSSFLFRRK